MPNAPAAEAIESLLVIQSAFIGDAILVSSLLESWHAEHPHTQIDLLVRKGNHALYEHYPFVRQLLVWDKQQGKYRQLLRLLRRIRRTRYDLIVNPHRFASSGLLSAFGGARYAVGFEKNPLSRFFSQRFAHEITTAPDSPHEIERNHRLIAQWVPGKALPPKLYPTDANQQNIKSLTTQPFCVIAPSSVWHTKQLPFEKWAELLKAFPADYPVYCIGAPGDRELCERLAATQPNTRSLAGELSLLDSAALLSHADRLYTNDSAPLHLASAVGCPTTAFFCSTVPAFGFGPLAPDSEVIEHPGELACRPCGLHGKRECPLGHFHCGRQIDVLSARLPV